MFSAFYLLSLFFITKKGFQKRLINKSLELSLMTDFYDCFFLNLVIKHCNILKAPSFCGVSKICKGHGSLWNNLLL